MTRIPIGYFSPPVQPYAAAVDRKLGNNDGTLDEADLDLFSKEVATGDYGSQLSQVCSALRQEHAALSLMLGGMSVPQEPRLKHVKTDRKLLKARSELFHALPNPLPGQLIVGTSFGMPEVISFAPGGQAIHDGIDFMADAGTPVTAVAGGHVQTFCMEHPGGERDASVLIYDPAFKLLYCYGHLDPESIPEAIYEAARSRKPLAVGTALGKVNHWLAPDYDHLHFSIGVSDDKRLIHEELSGTSLADLAYSPKTRFLNPLCFLRELKDKTPPQVDSIFLRDDDGNTLDLKQPIRGRVHLFASVRDFLGKSKYLVQPHEVSLTIRCLTGTKKKVLDRVVWNFDTVPLNAQTDPINHLYLVDPKPGQPTCSGPYGDRCCIFKLTNDLEGVAPHGWDTAAKKGGVPLVPNGKYEIEVTVAGMNGKKTSHRVEVEVQNRR